MNSDISNGMKKNIAKSSYILILKYNRILTILSIHGDIVWKMLFSKKKIENSVIIQQTIKSIIIYKKKSVEK